MFKNLSDIYKARKQIFEGIQNKLLKKEFVENVSEYRLKICKSCEYYDGKCSVPGTGPCCGACGCSLALKTRSLSSPCGLTALNQTPKWLPVINSKQEKEFENE